MRLINHLSQRSLIPIPEQCGSKSTWSCVGSYKRCLKPATSVPLSCLVKYDFPLAHGLWPSPLNLGQYDSYIPKSTKKGGLNTAPISWITWTTSLLCMLAKSWPTLDAWNAKDNGKNHLSTGVGFLPSTVSRSAPSCCSLIKPLCSKRLKSYSPVSNPSGHFYGNVLFG